MTVRTKVRAALRSGVNGEGRDRTDRGDTLVEILMTLVVLSITVLGLIVAFGTSISASVDHRNLAANDVVLRSAAEAALSQIQQQPSSSPTATPYVSCATPSSYPSTNNFGTPTSTYTAVVKTVEYWNAAAADFVTSPCTPNAPEQITMQVTNTSSGAVLYTNFVVDARGVNTASAFSVTGISPSTIVAGTFQVVSITGTGFANGDGDTVTFSGSGVSAGPVTITTTKSLNVVVTASSSAAGTYSVTVTDPTTGASATSSTPILTVTTPLSVTSVSPSAQPQGTSNQPLTLTGTGFASGASVSFSGTGVSAGATSGSGNTLTFNVSITSGASAVARTITVTNPGGASATSASPIFTVTGTPSTVLDVNLMIGSYDGASKKNWDAMVTIDVVDSHDNAISGVTVTGTWDNPVGTDTLTCTTNATGSCKVEDGVSLNLTNHVPSVTFTVTNLSATGYTYNSSGNFQNPASATVSQP